MPRGYWIYRGHPQDLLKHAESIGCARLGLPLLPEKRSASAKTASRRPWMRNRLQTQIGSGAAGKSSSAVRRARVRPVRGRTSEGVDRDAVGSTP